MAFRSEKYLVKSKKNTINIYYGHEVVYYKGNTKGQAGKFIRINEDEALRIDAENKLEEELDRIQYSLNGI